MDNFHWKLSATESQPSRCTQYEKQDKMKNIIPATLFFSAILFSCNSEKPKDTNKEKTFKFREMYKVGRNTENGLILLTEKQQQELSEKLKQLNLDLPTIGLLMYDNVLTTELTAPMDVFTKLTEDGKQLFNVITIAETYDFIVSEEGLKMFPDYILENSPKLDILIVPSAYDMSLQVKNQNLVDFIRAQNNNTEYTVSNCAGATLIGESGIADGKKIVTWIGGGEDLQKNYPNLKV